MQHEVNELELKNGARGLVINIPGAPVMSSQFHFRAGNRYTKENKEQTAHIMEHMAFGANSEYQNGQAFDEIFTKNGAINNAYTSDYGMGYWAECPAFEWDRILELQKLTICSPKFIQSEFEGEVGNVKSELTGYLNDAERTLWPRMSQELGEKTLTNQESLDTISNISVSDIRNHYKRTHTAENMRFVVAGDFTDNQKKLKRILNSFELDEGERLPIPVDEMHSFDPFVVRRKDISNITFGITLNLSRRLSDAELNAMNCLDHILTGTMHGMIQGESRKKGLSYHIWSQTSQYEHNSSWDFGAQVNIDKIEDLFELIAKQLEKIKLGEIDEKQIADAKTYAFGRRQMTSQTVNQIAHWYADRYFFDGVINDYENAVEQIKAVDCDQIIAIANEFFSSAIWGIGLYGSADKELATTLHEKLKVLFA